MRWRSMCITHKPPLKSNIIYLQTFWPNKSCRKVKSVTMDWWNRYSRFTSFLKKYFVEYYCMIRIKYKSNAFIAHQRLYKRIYKRTIIKWRGVKKPFMHRHKETKKIKYPNQNYLDHRGYITASLLVTTIILYHWNGILTVLRNCTAIKEYTEQLSFMKPNSCL